ncbi:unnamed protein product [Victoria cruziana]
MPPKGSGKKLNPRFSPAAGHKSSREMGSSPKTTAASKPGPKVSSKIIVKPKEPPSATPQTDPNSHPTHPPTNTSLVSQPEAAEKTEFEAAEQRKIRRTEIFVGGLDEDVKEEDIRKVFEKVGEIVEVRLMKNSQTGKSEGYASLRYAKPTEAQRALNELARAELQIQTGSSVAESLNDGSPFSYACYSKVHNGHADAKQRLGIRTPNKDVKRTSTYPSSEGWLGIASKSTKVMMAMKYFLLPENLSRGIHERQYGSSSFSKEFRNELLNTPPQFSSTNISPVNSVDHSGDQSFDICESQSSKKGGPVKLKPSILVMNREKRKGEECSLPKELKPGMIYLRNYLTPENQVKLIKECRELGKASGGFYQPSFSSGHKMHLHMMCLGKNWDPETSKYGDVRHDGTRPHDIPDYFKGLVQKVLEVAQGHLKNYSKLELPAMNPDICIVNFYSKSGKLGLHQDKDESPGSIQKGLPVVSFSVGDSAEFLFGEDRDVEKAQKCRLDSGDVLIFGGKSRLVFHGVPTIFPDTAPKQLLEQTNLRPGRLNLTFRQY